MSQIEAGLKVAGALHDFINAEALPGTGLDPAAFWQGFTDIVRDLAPANRALLETRVAMQAQIDAYHRDHRGKPADASAYVGFLRSIGYLLPEPPDFAITTENVDPEIASIPGPQLVVPAMNARYALNAANARWGSLYDALYGTDVIPEDGGATRSGGFNKVRGARVIARAREMLDQTVPLAGGSHADAVSYNLLHDRLLVKLSNGVETALFHETAFVGYRGDVTGLHAVLLRHNNLHLEIQIDPAIRSAARTRRMSPTC